MSQPFRILSLDGGGIMGAFAASALAAFERRTGRRIVDHFDLITGTSTGGIIAIGLAMGATGRGGLSLLQVRGAEIAGRFAPPPGVQLPAPAMTNSITLIVKGLTDLSAGKDFSDKLTELVVRVSGGGGYTLSSTGGAGWSNYSITMHNALDVKAFADQITWARVTRISGQTIEIDASAH